MHPRTMTCASMNSDQVWLAGTTRSDGQQILWSGDMVESETISTGTAGTLLGSPSGATRTTGR
eukprot:9296438-Pyramimonas_sp.AAC.1